MNSEMKELFEQGKRQFAGRNYLRAEQLLQKVLRSGWRYADVLNMLGVIYHMEGKFNNAIESFEEALQINPNYAEATLNLAVLFNDLGEYKKGRDLYAKVQKKKSPAGADSMTLGKLANMHAQLGDTYRGIGLCKEAIDEYQKALKLCPSYVDIRTQLGICYRENNQRDLAVKELTAAVDQKPSYKDASIQLGVTYYAGGQKNKAEAVWQKLLKKDPDNEIVKMYLRLCENGKASGKK